MFFQLIELNLNDILWVATVQNAFYLLNLQTPTFRRLDHYRNPFLYILFTIITMNTGFNMYATDCIVIWSIQWINPIRVRISMISVWYEFKSACLGQYLFA